jgi:hypothetical protein
MPCCANGRRRTRLTRKRLIVLVMVLLPGPPRSRMLPEISSRCTKGPELAGIRATVRSQRRHRYRRQVVSAHFYLALKSRFPETETAIGRDSVRMPVTPKEGGTRPAAFFGTLNGLSCYFLCRGSNWCLTSATYENA